MDDRSCLNLIRHGAAVFLAGLLAGVPYALVITGAMAGEDRAWRMAHAEGIQNGLLLLAVAGIGGKLALDARKSRLASLGLIAAAWGNVIASVIGAATGNRGLEATGPAANLLVYGLFLVAIVGVFTGVGLVVAGAGNAAKQR